MTPAPTCTRCGFSWNASRFEACPRCLLSVEIEPVVVGGLIEVGDEIGRGGMGVVHRGRHRGLDRDVAIKFLPPAVSREADARARFEREVRALAALSHPNIVGLVASGEDDGQMWVAMEFVDGNALSTRMPLSRDHALAVVAEICDALAYAHAQGIVHRDIKPANILLDGAGHAKVADFGIARLAGDRGAGWTVTRSSGVVGTPQYLAPEALAGGAPPDPRMDIWSVGVLLHQLVTGVLPVGTFQPAPAPIDAIVARALAASPSDRFQTAGDMATAIRSIAGVSRAGHDALPSDEGLWISVVACLQSVSTALAVFAAMQSVTPRVMRADEVMPLVMLATERLPDGRIISRARFELWWTLLAILAFCVAITGYALLRRHWRRTGFDEVRPDAPMVHSKTVLRWGAFSVAVYGVHVLLQGVGASPGVAVFAPIVGGIIELVVLYVFWVAVLHALRVGRPLRREPGIWVGLGLAVLPPTIDFIRFLAAWKP